MDEKDKYKLPNALSFLNNMIVNYKTISKDPKVTGYGELAFLHKATDAIQIMVELLNEAENYKSLYAITKESQKSFMDATGLYDIDWMSEEEKEKLKAFCKRMQNEHYGDDEDEAY